MRNTIGKVDRVEYFGGATFVLQEHGDGSGVSLGNYINANLKGTYKGVPGDPLLMHEYGHTFDSQRFGLSYLFAVGIPSAISALHSVHADGEPGYVTTHDFYWTEMRANRHAARYFKKYYGIEWSTYETYYPTKNR